MTTPDPTTPARWTRGFRITWPDGYDGLHGAQFPSGRVVVDDTTGGLVEAATSIDALTLLKDRPLGRIEWPPALPPAPTARDDAANALRQAADALIAMTTDPFDLLTESVGVRAVLLVAQWLQDRATAAEAKQAGRP